MPRILGTTLTINFLSGLVQTAQCALKKWKSEPLQEPTVTLQEPAAINHVYLFNGDRISGAVVSLNKDALFIECVLSERLRIDMRAVMAVDFQPKTQQKFQPRKEEMDKVDLANGDKITGDVLSLSGKTITIKGEYGKLVLKKEGLSHIVFGLREKIDLGFPKEEKNVATLKLVNGDTVSGKLLNFSDDVFHFTAKYSPDLKIKSQHVSALTFTRAKAYNSADWGHGSDGALAVNSVNTIINNYAYLIKDALSEGNEIAVNSTSGFSAGDEILIIQMQDYSSGIAGNYEFKKISSVSGNNLNLISKLDNSYYSGMFDSPTATATQIVRVPQYSSVKINSGASITAPAWDGYKGGIVVFRVSGTASIVGSIDVTGKGFRGGKGGPASYPSQGYQGESYKGKGTDRSFPNYGAGGGGYKQGSGTCSGGGGGGGFFAEGPIGGPGKDAIGDHDHKACPGRGGNPYGSVDLAYLYLGSGGGGGSGGGYWGVSGKDGGSGGGIILIYANMLKFDGSIEAKGNKGEDATSPNGDHGAGGGASGGSIYIERGKLFLNGSITAAGGSGGLIIDPPVEKQAGGNGGEGRIN